SLFDGISCGHVALRKAGYNVDNYFASEIDPNAIKVTQKNFPDTKQLGDVQQVHATKLPKIDLLIGGSPCQGFSNAGKRKNFDDPRSRLFWEYVRILKETQPKYFLLENVVMKQEWQDVISDAVGVKPIMINSALTSAAVRKRLYWTNIPDIEQPEDYGITFGDVREHGHPKDNMYYTDKAMDWIRKQEDRTGKKLRIIGDSDKMQMLEASMFKKYSAQRFFGIQDTYGLRYITPLECERCMNVPDGYTDCISNTARYKALGNGWEVNTITHIFKHMK
ncbi:MAG: DNA (cytosine-5-)-methyltransferase, partial [Acetivibrionales bacterium]